MYSVPLGQGNGMRDKNVRKTWNNLPFRLTELNVPNTVATESESQNYRFTTVLAIESMQ